MRRVEIRDLGLLVAACALLLTGCARTRPICRQTPGAYTHPCGAGARTFHYLLYRPPGHGAPRPDGSRWPLLVYLPGASTHGADVRAIPDGDPADEIERGRDLPMVVLSAMTPSMGEAWSPEVVIGLVDHAIAAYDVDPQRVYLTGVCVGGTGVWDTIKAYPERIAAAAPLCAWGSTCGIESAAEVPVWAFHGSLDIFTFAFRHKRLVDAHRAAGGETCWTAYPRSMHWIWAQTYARDDLYAWLLAQRKAPAVALMDASPPRGRATSRTSVHAYATRSGEVPARGTGSRVDRAGRTAR